MTTCTSPTYASSGSVGEAELEPQSSVVGLSVERAPTGRFNSEDICRTSCRRCARVGGTGAAASAVAAPATASGCASASGAPSFSVGARLGQSASSTNWAAHLGGVSSEALPAAPPPPAADVISPSDQAGEGCRSDASGEQGVGKEVAPDSDDAEVA